MNGNTLQRNRRERPVCRSGNAANRTSAVEWYCASRGGILAARHVATITCVVERNHPPTCHPDRNEMEWRDLPKLQALPYAGYYCNLSGFLHSADAAVGMTYQRGTVHPHRLYSIRSGRQDCRPYRRGTIHPHGLYPRTLTERHTGRSLRFR